MTPRQLLLMLSGGTWTRESPFEVREGESFWAARARRRAAWRRFEDPDFSA